MHSMRLLRLQIQRMNTFHFLMPPKHFLLNSWHHQLLSLPNQRLTERLQDYLLIALLWQKHCQRLSLLRSLHPQLFLQLYPPNLMRSGHYPALMQLCYMRLLPVSGHFPLPVLLFHPARRLLLRRPLMLRHIFPVRHQVHPERYQLLNLLLLLRLPRFHTQFSHPLSPHWLFPLLPGLCQLYL